MPRTIDSLSTRKDGDSKPAKVGTVYARDKKAKNTKATDSTTYQANVPDSKRRPFLRVVMLFLMLLVLVGGIGATYMYLTKKPTTINGQEKLSLTDPNTKKKAEESFNNSTPIATLSESDREQVRKDIGPKYYAAYAAGFAPTQDDLNQFTLIFGTSPSKEQVKQAYDSIIDKKIELIKTTGYYESYVFYFWFGRSIANKLPEETISGWNDPKVLADDKAYAEAKANEYRSKLQDGTMTESAIIAALEADNRLQLYDEANGSALYKTALSNDIPVNDDGRIASLDKFLQQQNQLGVSAIGTLQADPGYPASGKQRDVGYVFVRLTTLLRGQEVADYYKQQLEVAKGFAQ